MTNEDYMLCECGDIRLNHWQGVGHCEASRCGCDLFKKTKEHLCECEAPIPLDKQLCVLCQTFYDTVTSAYFEKRERERNHEKIQRSDSAA